MVKKDGGLRTHVRISHVFALDVPTLDEILFISDAAINIAPDLMTKVDIVQNAIDLARACGLDQPRVGILSAVETINPAIPSTLDAAVLSKMAERGQIRGAVVDGPLAMDNAIDIEAARTKGIASLVAGRANVLIVPNLEAGNMLAKELTFVARAEAAGLVLGAKVPVMLTSRADNDRARLASCALAQLYEYYRREGRAFGATNRRSPRRRSDARRFGNVLTLNAGSSSLKFAAFGSRTRRSEPARLRARSRASARPPKARSRRVRRDRPSSASTRRTRAVDHDAAMGVILGWLDGGLSSGHRAVGHRVVHGGPT